MSSPLIPMELEKWDMPTLNSLKKLRDIERETFDFKGVEFILLGTTLSVLLYDNVFQAILSKIQITKMGQLHGVK